MSPLVAFTHQKHKVNVVMDLNICKSPSPREGGILCIFLKVGRDHTYENALTLRLLLYK